MGSAKALLSAGCDAAAVAEDGSTALMLAAVNGRAALLPWLLEHGAALEARDGDGFTAFLFPCEGPLALSKSWSKTNRVLRFKIALFAIYILDRRVIVSTVRRTRASTSSSSDVNRGRHFQILNTH